MKKKRIITLFLVSLCVLLFSFVTTKEKSSVINFSLLTTQKTYKAGTTIKLSFNTQNNTIASLWVKSSYGSIVLNGTTKNDTTSFILPDFYAQKAGHISWTLVKQENTILQGNFTIIPENHVRLENYLGPRSMPVSDGHYTMMVSIPTDRYDNPKPDNTLTKIQWQFLDNITRKTIPTKDFISWLRIYSPEKSGKLLTSTSCLGVETKETETDVYPTIPVDFKIDYSRNHAFADGNQTTTLTSSIIKDKFDNTVGDGTMVTYIATTSKNTILKTYGATINGVAQAEILSPEYTETYTIKAYIDGMAESNTINVSYKPIKTAIEYLFSDDKRTITIGPVKSFMNQIAPDGTTVTLQVYHKDELVNTISEYTRRGMASFKLSEEAYNKSEYNFTITVFGNTVTTETIHYNADK
ncbi:MAG: hypothetical protein BM557_05695 [Flavobacterium sp. MedPE-SWcel]|uniref:hypothetical protein n=1 Tax=uncultured Flavobacterium sp. TaxID=165435 RepID=UPI000921A1A9|nr:hypothetical protein [uncultured Flavobacterium sp.]OIQ20161.1 MAG: hypothetical protein BM557_05695 [Flavobacterium sp. MedPE-SWcel]